MLLKVVSDQGVKRFDELKVGDLILCENKVYKPIKNIVMISDYPIYFRTSNNLSAHISRRMKIKTEKGFKSPELWDTLTMEDSVTPMITAVKTGEDIRFFYDILIEGNIVSSDGIIFKYSD
jgi:hypothetical protein